MKEYQVNDKVYCIYDRRVFGAFVRDNRSKYYKLDIGAAYIHVDVEEICGTFEEANDKLQLMNSEFLENLRKIERNLVSLRVQYDCVYDFRNSNKYFIGIDKDGYDISIRNSWRSIWLERE